MLNRIFQFLTGVGVDETLQSQARQVRQIARDLDLSVFPEIFKDLQHCSICKQSKLLLVHPDLICYSCFIDAANQAHGEAFK